MRFETTGRGRKLCPSCSFYVGVGTHTCECGHAFEKKAAPVPVVMRNEQIGPSDLNKLANAAKSVPDVVERLSQEPRRCDGVQLVMIPAGACPVKLGDDPIAWAQKVLDDYESRGIKLMTKGLIYHLREFHDTFSPEFKSIKSLLVSEFAEVEV